MPARRCHDSVVRQGCGTGALGAGSTFPGQCRGDQAGVRPAGARPRRLEQHPPLGQLGGHRLARLELLGDRLSPGADRISPGLDRVAVARIVPKSCGAAPSVVRDQAHGGLRPASLVLPADEERRVQQVVAIAEDVGGDAQLVAHDALDRGLAAVHLGIDGLDHDRPARPDGVRPGFERGMGGCGGAREGCSGRRHRLGAQPYPIHPRVGCGRHARQQPSPPARDRGRSDGSAGGWLQLTERQPRAVAVGPRLRQSLVRGRLRPSLARAELSPRWRGCGWRRSPRALRTPPGSRTLATAAAGCSSTSRLVGSVSSRRTEPCAPPTSWTSRIALRPAASAVSLGSRFILTSPGTDACSFITAAPTTAPRSSPS